MSRYLLMIPGFLFLIFPVPTGSNELEVQMEKDTSQVNKLTHKETSTWSRMLDNLSEEHVHRLYDAYRERWKGEGDEAEREAKLIAVESQSLAPIKQDIIPIKKTLVKTGDKEKSSLPTIKYDATDDRSVPSSKCLASFPLRKKVKDMKVKDKECSDRKAADEPNMIYTQSRLPLKNMEKYVKGKVKESPERKPSEESRMIQIKKKDREKPEEKASPGSTMINLKKNKEKPGAKTSPESTMMDAKKSKEKPEEKTSPESKKKYKEKPEGKASVVSTMTVVKFDLPAKMVKVKPSDKPDSQEERNQRIMELNRIYNEYLKAWQQPSPSDPLKTEKAAKAMGPPGVRLSALVDLLNVVERFQQSDLVSDLAKKINQEMEPNLTNQINHDASLVTDSRASLKGIIKNDLSGLFENMKPSSASTAFQQILSDIKSRSASIKAGGLYDEYKKGFCKIFSDQKHPRQSEYPADIQGIKCDNAKSNSLSKVSVPASPTRNQNYLKALETFTKINRESNQNGGTKPYFLPKSKNRQLIHNDIPLIKSGLSDASKKSSDGGAKLKSLKSTNKESLSKETNGAAYGKNVPKQDMNKLKEPAPKTESKEPPATPLLDLYSGLDPKHITNGIKAIKNSSFFNLVDEYQKQLESLNQALKTKQGWWKEARTKGKSCDRKPAKRNLHMNSPANGANMPVPFPEVLVNQAPQMGVNVLGNMANQMHVSPIEMAQRIVGAGQVAAAHPRMALPQMQLASQLGANSVPKGPDFTCNIPCQQDQQPYQQQQQQQGGISPVLDKILQRLETIQATKCNQSAEEEEKNLPCCFADPADGAPCDLNGSWESLVLGVRINIKSNSIAAAPEEQKTKPTCVQPKSGRSKYASCQRLRRQCVKMDPTKLKEVSVRDSPSGAGIALNVSVQETVPPRAHDLLDNLTDWHFSGNALMILGGPISLSFRKVNSNLIGHFVGYCRTCGCLDTIFGSWTFCQPSRDCQDIAMSIVDRRDMLRRYSMDERRKNRFKEQLYMGSKFAKMEKERLRHEQESNEVHRPQKQSDPSSK